MATVIHGFGPNGELSPGATAALAGLGGGGGTSDHGALTGLGDDDHTQYHTDARGDARYYTKGQVDGLVSGATPVAAGSAFPRALSLAAVGLANCDTTPFKVLLLGDSLTWSGSAWVDRFVTRLATLTGEPGVTLKSKVAGDISVPTDGIYGVNCAADAASSGNYIANGNAVAMATTLQPALVIHGVGTNNHMGSTPLGTFKANIEAAIASIDGACTLPPVHLFWLFGSLYFDKPYDADDYLGQILDIATADPDRVAVADLGPYADALGVHAADPYSLDGGDGLHLTAAGYKTIGELMARIVATAAPAPNVIGYSAANPTTTTTTTAATTTTTTTEGETTTTTTTEATTTTTTTAGGGPTTITDSFNRADSTTSLGVTDTGQTWQQLGTGIVGISSNQAYRATSNAFAVVDFGQADMLVTVQVVTTGSFFAGPVARASNAANFYYVETGAGSVAKLKKFEAGAELNVIGGTTHTFADGDTLGIQCKEVGGGTEVKLLINGTVMQTLTDSSATRPTGTKGGLRPWNLSPGRWDDFSITAPA